MKYLETYETYTSMNYPDLYDEPVPDYVDTDYYKFDVEEDEENQEDKTSRNDYQGTKRKKKKPVYTISAS
jgi:hypothetical protein